LKALHQRLKTTTIYVTHDQEEAMTLGDRIVVMSRGIIQQAGPSLEVYRHPANRFVASFIGTPPMNFFEGTLRQGSGGLVFSEGSQDADGRPYELSIPPGRSEALLGHVGKSVVLGVRPQMLTEAGEPMAGRTWKVPIKVVEPLGESVDVMCGTPKHERLVARIPARDGLTPRLLLHLHFDMERVHFFEIGEFGLRIC
jgi:multiple sugar transport system ATP-binding protein